MDLDCQGIKLSSEPTMGIKNFTYVQKDLNKPQWEEKCKQAYGKVLSSIQKTIEILKQSTLDEGLSLNICYYFCLSNDLISNNKQQIIFILQNTLIGLTTNEFTIHLGAVFSNSKYNSNKIELRGGDFGYKTIYHLIFDFIHEATHCYANTVDHSEKGYISKEGKFRQTGLKMNEALNNAESYSCIVCVCSSIPFYD